MFTGYNLKLEKNDKNILDKYIEIGEEHLNINKANIEKSINSYIKNNTLNGTSVQDAWFPTIQADVFISHSHMDEELVKGLAGWLYKEFGLNCFVDSCIWGYKDDLIHMITSNENYDISATSKTDCRNCKFILTNVDLMLNIALEKMIDKVEVIFFINTDNSISKDGEFYKDETYSPWLYSELSCIQLIRNKNLSEYRENIEDIYESILFENEKFDIKIAYDVSMQLEKLEKIDFNILHVWLIYYNYICKFLAIKPNTIPLRIKALDFLYINTYNKKTERLRNLLNNTLGKNLVDIYVFLKDINLK